MCSARRDDSGPARPSSPANRRAPAAPRRALARAVGVTTLGAATVVGAVMPSVARAADGVPRVVVTRWRGEGQRPMAGDAWRTDAALAQALARPGVRRQIRRWAHQRGLRVDLMALTAPRQRRGQRRSQALDSLEAALERARIAVDGQEPSRARLLLDGLEVQLRRGARRIPAGWLLAEVHHLRARLALARGDARRAAAAEAAAELLAGPRASTFGTAPLPRGAGTPKARLSRLSLPGLRGGDVVLLDGRQVVATARPPGERTAAAFRVPVGEHHLIVRRGGAVIFADFVSVPVAGVDLGRRLAAAVTPCSRADVRASTPAERAQVACPLWVELRTPATSATRPGGAGLVSIRWCRGRRAGKPGYCGPFAPLNPVADPRGGPSPLLSRAPQPRPERPAATAWWIAGAGVAVAAAVVIGVLLGGPAEEEAGPRWRYDGP